MSRTLLVVDCRHPCKAPEERPRDPFFWRVSGPCDGLLRSCRTYTVRGAGPEREVHLHRSTPPPVGPGEVPRTYTLHLLGAPPGLPARPVAAIHLGPLLTPRGSSYWADRTGTGPSRVPVRGYGLSDVFSGRVAHSSRTRVGFRYEQDVHTYLQTLSSGISSSFAPRTNPPHDHGSASSVGSLVPRR